MPSRSSKASSRVATMSAPFPPVVFPVGGFISPPAHRSDASEDEATSSDSPFFTTDELELTPPKLNQAAEDAYQADEDTAGFPGPHAYQTIVYEYLKGLSPKKREKALLNVVMYSSVMYVLNNPKDTGYRTAQFRFWAKKMFCLTEYAGDWVLTHDGKPVACREQMHGVLKHCHAIAGHGGRDKTSAEVRKFYSWIPKEIVAKFVQVCPSCKSKRTLSSAALGIMTGSQTFFCNLQNTEQKLAQGKAVSLAQARAHAQSVIYSRNHGGGGKPLAPIGHGRIHNVGSSHLPPQNAVNYNQVTHYAPHSNSTYQPPHFHDGAFGQADFFHPPSHHTMQPPTFTRSISFDADSSHHYQPQMPDMRRVSAPAFIPYPAESSYSARGQWPHPAPEHQQASASSSYLPMAQMHIGPHDAEFDTLGDVREACGSSAKQSLEEDFYGTPSQNFANLQIDPRLTDYSYHTPTIREYEPIYDSRLLHVPSGGASGSHMPQYTGSSMHTADTSSQPFDPKDLYEFSTFDGDHDSPLSVNELDFAELSTADAPATEQHESLPFELREALNEYANQEMLAAGPYA